jgi:hypothetical protein
LEPPPPKKKKIGDDTDKDLISESDDDAESFLFPIDNDKIFKDFLKCLRNPKFLNSAASKICEEIDKEINKNSIVQILDAITSINIRINYTTSKESPLRQKEKLSDHNFEKLLKETILLCLKRDNDNRDIEILWNELQPEY